jgi:membrane protease YdiL (CAAX protease family)
MNIKNILLAELILLFVALPFVLLIPIPIPVKVGTMLLGVAYVLTVTVKNKLVSRKSLYSWPEKSYWKYVFLRFVLLVFISTALMYLFEPGKLFIVVKTNIWFWLMLSAFYSIFSVYPQEFLYRSFFFARYRNLVKNPILFIAINAIAFSLAHVGFKNILVLVITFIGGVVFAITYFKTKSLLFTSVEHAIYGSWLFTLGAGEMLAFPMPA